MQVETMTAKECGGCATSCNSAHLTKLGINADKFDFVIALAGNPNTGKSTIFNQLTGLRQHVGNWAGKTVARAEGAFNFPASARLFSRQLRPGLRRLEF